MGHHGSSTSSIMSMLNHVSPKYAVISVGKNNRYGHPSEKIVQRWVDIGAEVFRSDESGAVIIAVDGEEMSINPMIPQLLKSILCLSWGVFRIIVNTHYK